MSDAEGLKPCSKPANAPLQRLSWQRSSSNQPQ